MLKLKEFREDRDLLQKDIASVLGVSQNTYSQYETGRRSIPVELLIKLCISFQVSADYLLNIPRKFQ